MNERLISKVSFNNRKRLTVCRPHKNQQNTYPKKKSRKIRSIILMHPKLAASLISGLCQQSSFPGYSSRANISHFSLLIKKHQQQQQKSQKTQQKFLSNNNNTFYFNIIHIFFAFKIFPRAVNKQ